MKKNPLEGIRVTDFTWAWAGPYSTMQLALLGAEVIKIESKKRPDHSRVRSLAAGRRLTNPNESPIFNDINLSKKGVTLDLTKPKAVELAKKMVSISDIVAENFRPGIMDKLGLGYNVLKEVKPDIIMLSSSALGATGPYRHYAGYAPTFAAISGIAHITGYKDGPPIPLMGSTDLRSATCSAFAILVALYHRAQTGEGQHIDLSSSEAISVLIGDAIMDYTMNNNIVSRKGNGDSVMAPHNCYQCREEDSWISIAVETDEEWQGLCDAMENPDWTKEKKFSDPYLRFENRTEMDRLIEEWTKDYSPYELMEKLQKLGVAAMPALTGKDLFNDPHLKERDFSAKVNHPVIGERTVIGPPWKLSETPAKIFSASPLMGEHNDYVFGDLLGIPKDKIEALKKEGVMGYFLIP